MMIMLINCMLCALMLVSMGSSAGFSANQEPVVSRGEHALIKFKVVKVTGGVRFARPLSAEFRLVKQGSFIPDGSIVQVPKLASISFESEDSLGREGVPVKRTQITINTPTIIRLGREAFRRVRLEPQMMKQFDSRIKKKIGDPQTMLAKLSDAWRQAVAMMSTDPAIDQETLRMLAEALNKGKNGDQSNISVSLGKINLITPREKQLILTDRMPLEMQVVWQRDDRLFDDLSSYDVYFWKQGQERTPYSRVTGTKAKITVNSPGNYYLQIESTDGSYKSRLRLVKIELSKKILNDKPHGISKAKQDAVNMALGRRIKPLAPDRNLVWTSKADWPLFGFEWTRPELCSENVLYDFVVLGPNNKELHKHATSDQTYQWRPPRETSGLITWEVRVIGCVDSGKNVVKLDINTMPRKIELVRPAGAAGSMKKVAQPRFNGTLFFDTL
jgi:hypothetical protein